MSAERTPVRYDPTTREVYSYDETPTVIHSRNWLNQGDFKIRAGEGTQPVTVHRCILAARSGFFRALLEGRMGDSRKGELTLKVPPPQHYRATSGLYCSSQCHTFTFATRGWHVFWIMRDLQAGFYFHITMKQYCNDALLASHPVQLFSNACFSG